MNSFQNNSEVTVWFYSPLSAFTWQVKARNQTEPKTWRCLTCGLFLATHCSSAQGLSSAQAQLSHRDHTICSPARASYGSKRVFLCATAAVPQVLLTQACWCVFQMNVAVLTEGLSTDQASEHIFASGGGR